MITDALTAVPETLDIDRGGRRVRVYRWGDAECRSIVLVHGAGASAHWWDHIAPLLVAPGLIGHAALIESRQELEGVCAALATRDASEGQIEQLRESVGITGELVSDPVRFSLENVRFHRLISEATGNDVIIAVSAALSELFFKETVNINYSESALRATVRAHTRIVKALSEHDSEVARAAMMKHLSGYDEYLSQTEQLASHS